MKHLFYFLHLTDINSRAQLECSLTIFTDLFTVVWDVTCFVIEFDHLVADKNNLYTAISTSAVSDGGHCGGERCTLTLTPVGKLSQNI
jgi:hypothetical protein